MIGLVIELKYGDIREDYLDRVEEKLCKIKGVCSYYSNKKVTVIVAGVDRLKDLEFHRIRWDIHNILVDMVRKDKTSGNEYFMLHALSEWMSLVCECIYYRCKRLSSYYKLMFNTVEEGDPDLTGSNGRAYEYGKENNTGTCSLNVWYQEIKDLDADCNDCDIKCEEQFSNHHENCPLGMCDDE